MVKIYLNILWRKNEKLILFIVIFGFINIIFANETLESKCNKGDAESCLKLGIKNTKGRLCKCV